MPIKNLREIIFYDFDLDKTAIERWAFIMDKYEKDLPNLRVNLKSVLAQYGSGTSFLKILYKFTSASYIKYYDEICYIAKRIDMDPYEILLMQLVYETASACTSAVLKFNGQEMFFRTMDWPMKFLKDITIGLNIKKNGVSIGRVTTWLGYVGFLTATSTVNNYTISINYRKTQDVSVSSLAKNLYRVISMKWPIGYLVRELVTKNASIDNAINNLTNAQLVSPCYITVFVPGGTSVIITRDCDKAVNIRSTELIQTNCDWNRCNPDILWSVKRRNILMRYQNKYKNTKDLTAEYILERLLCHPVYNDDTIYVHYQYLGEHKTLV